MKKYFVQVGQMLMSFLKTNNYSLEPIGYNTRITMVLPSFAHKKEEELFFKNPRLWILHEKEQGLWELQQPTEQLNHSEIVQALNTFYVIEILVKNNLPDTLPKMCRELFSVDNETQQSLFLFHHTESEEMFEAMSKTLDA